MESFRLKSGKKGIGLIQGAPGMRVLPHAIRCITLPLPSHMKYSQPMRLLKPQCSGFYWNFITEACDCHVRSVSIAGVT